MDKPPAPPPLGRKLKLTKAISDEIVGAIRIGCPNAMAAEAAGISEPTFYRWLAEGKKKPRKHPLAIFQKAVEQALGQSMRLRVTRIAKAGEVSWQADAWWLERRYPELFGLRASVEHSGSVDIGLDELNILRKAMMQNTDEPILEAAGITIAPIADDATVDAPPTIAN